MDRSAPEDIVVTGMGVISPLGIGVDALDEGLYAGRSGIGPIDWFDSSQLPTRIAGRIDNFDPRHYVRPRKSLKVMSRGIQLAVAAAVMAYEDAGVAGAALSPDRQGVVYGSDMMRFDMSEIERLYRVSVVDGRFEMARWATLGFKEAYPLSMLRILPNMLASQISIAFDARGPNNAITMQELSSPQSIIESAEIIRRGAADLMIAGGASCRLHPLELTRMCLHCQMSPRTLADGPAAPRPFDVDRDGQVIGEGAGAFVLETRRHAEARGARIHATLAGWSSACEPCPNGRPPSGASICRTIRLAMERAGLAARDVGFISAHGLGTVHDDPVEARALHEALPQVPVTALKSSLGNLNAAAGSVELAACMIGLRRHRIPPTINHRQTAPDCPIPVVDHPQAQPTAPACVSVNYTGRGEVASAIVVTA